MALCRSVPTTHTYPSAVESSFPALNKLESLALIVFHLHSVTFRVTAPVAAGEKVAVVGNTQALGERSSLSNTNVSGARRRSLAQLRMLFQVQPDAQPFADVINPCPFVLQAVGMRAKLFHLILQLTGASQSLSQETAISAARPLDRGIHIETSSRQAEPPLCPSFVVLRCAATRFGSLPGLCSPRQTVPCTTST